MLVKLLAPLEDLERGVGEKVELAVNRAIALIRAGYAVPARPKPERAAKKPAETRSKA